MKIIWKAVELADWKTPSFDPSVVFSCIFSVVAACVLPPTYWGSLGDTLRGARAGHSPFGSASIVWKIDEGDVSNGSWVFSDSFPYLYICHIIIYHITVCLYYASYILFSHFYSIQLAFRSIIVFPTWILYDTWFKQLLVLNKQWIKCQGGEMRRGTMLWGSGDVWRLVMVMTALEMKPSGSASLDWTASSFSKFFRRS